MKYINTPYAIFFFLQHPSNISKYKKKCMNFIHFIQSSFFTTFFKYIEVKNIYIYIYVKKKFIYIFIISQVLSFLILIRRKLNFFF